MFLPRSWYLIDTGTGQGWVTSCESSFTQHYNCHIQNSAFTTSLPSGDRFNNCSGHSSASHCTHDVVYRPVRPRLLVWLYKGVRHRQAWDFDGQDGAAEYPRQYLQLDKGVLWAALSLYEICRGMLDGCSGESQCYTRFWTGPSFVHRHRSRLAPDYARESHFQIGWRHVPCGTGGKLKFSTGWSIPYRSLGI